VRVFPHPWNITDVGWGYPAKGAEGYEWTFPHDPREVQGHRAWYQTLSSLMKPEPNNIYEVKLLYNYC